MLILRFDPPLIQQIVFIVANVFDFDIFIDLNTEHIFALLRLLDSVDQKTAAIEVVEVNVILNTVLLLATEMLRTLQRNFS